MFRVLDLDGNEIEAGDIVIFTDQSDLCRGSLVEFIGKTRICARIYDWEYKRIRKFKLFESHYYSIRSKTTIGEDTFFKTKRLLLDKRKEEKENEG